MRTLAPLLGLALLLPLARADDPVIAHEWGTFTCLQDDDGEALGSINVDDEPVPHFVGSIGGVNVTSLYGEEEWAFGLPPYSAFASKGGPMPVCAPSVTMRLETPVLYIYPPKGHAPQTVPPLDVHVDFLGGILSQFYPRADFAGLPTRHYPGNPQLDGKVPYVPGTDGITEKITTSLDWKGVHLGSTEQPIETTDKVWTTPREVSAPVLEVKYDEKDSQGATQSYTQAEHFLFYRGIGHLDSPLKLVRHSDQMGEKKELEIWSALAKASPDKHSKGAMEAAEIADRSVYDHAWLADIHADGSCAFRSISKFGGAQTRTEMSPIVETTSGFGAADFDVKNLAQLKASMHDALVKEGLYPDEAAAMLRTWELSYFKSPGLRFFYIVPRAWVDKVLPLKMAGASVDITRVMVGRIELVTDAQKIALARLAAGPCPDLTPVKQQASEALRKMPGEQAQAYYRGEKPLSELGIKIPPLVGDYLSLGRFRDALIVHEQKAHSSVALAQFIKDNSLAPER